VSRRYYLSPVSITDLGDGNGPQAVCKAIANYTHTDHAQVVALNADGTLRLNWGLCAIEAANHLPIIADPNIRVLPSYPFDGRLSGLQPGALAVLRAAMQAFNIDDATMLGNDLSVGFRVPIRNLGRLLDSTFNENNFL
jgi:hypothetical protein